MANKQLTQIGLNRAMFVMVKRLGGRIAIPESQLENPNTEDALKIQYHPNEKVFVFQLHKVKAQDKSIIWTGGN